MSGGLTPCRQLRPSSRRELVSASNSHVMEGKRYYLEPHASRVPKRKLLETRVTLPTVKVHRRDESEQMDCDEVSE